MLAPYDLSQPGALDAFAGPFAAAEVRVHAFADERERGTRWAEEAALLEVDTRPLPLRGVPLGIKDIFHVDGLPTGAGSQLPVAELTGTEGPAVARLRRAGALVVGKTATTEFAYFAPATTRNPHATDHTPGGSSSGSAAAVASGQCRLALGTQTIGSIGRPAAFCGVVGYKPSYDRVERDGVIPLAPSLDHVGLFAPDLDSMRRGAAVLVPDWQKNEAPLATRPLRLGVPTGPYNDPCDSAGREHFAATLAALRRAGHEIVEVDLFPDIAEIATRHRRLMAAETAQVHAGWLVAYRHLYQPATLELIDRGRGVPAATVENDRAARITLRCRVDAAFDDALLDLWLSPPAPGPAPLGLGSTGDPSLNLPWTQAGVPTLVLPTGRHGSLPLGLQLAGRFGDDEGLFDRAAALAPDLPAPNLPAAQDLPAATPEATG